MVEQSSGEVLIVPVTLIKVSTGTYQRVRRSAEPAAMQGFRIEKTIECPVGSGHRRVVIIGRQHPDDRVGLGENNLRRPAQQFIVGMLI
ncbi:MAG: hypothetical protein IIV20_04925 [Bacteroidaceae bacterium]|nr:hypothetical protein [Bacteroidaceae bacterium]